MKTGCPISKPTISLPGLTFSKFVLMPMRYPIGLLSPISSDSHSLSILQIYFCYVSTNIRHGLIISIYNDLSSSFMAIEIFHAVLICAKSKYIPFDINSKNLASTIFSVKKIISPCQEIRLVILLLKVHFLDYFLIDIIIGNAFSRFELSRYWDQTRLRLRSKQITIFVVSLLHIHD